MDSVQTTTSTPATSSVQNSQSEQSSSTEPGSPVVGNTPSTVSSLCIPPQDLTSVEAVVKMFTELFEKVISMFQAIFDRMAGMIEAKEGEPPASTAPVGGSEEPPAETPPSDGDTTCPPTSEPPTSEAPGTGSTGGSSGTNETPCTEQPTDDTEEKDVKTKDLLSWNPKNSAGHPEVRVPERFAEGARSVRILDKDGKVIAAGKFIKFGPAGRAVFQLPKKDYPEGIIVEVTQKNGTVRKLEIPNSDVRYKNPLA